MSTFVRGATLGRYRIERLLGSGAMGEVYLAEDPQIGRRVALKTLRIVGVRPEELPERRQRLLREARTAGRLIHPHVVTLFDAGEDGAFIYLAFEYVPGSDLGVRLGAGPPLTLGEALRLAGETCAGLDHAHRAGIVHRDIKPSNLLLDADGRLKISDFGIAKMAGQATELTVTGSVMGSPHYLSPEQIRGEELDGRSDLFSFGVVLYEMLARRRPFGGETLSTLIYQVLQAEPAPLQGLRPDLPPRLAALVARLLAKDRDDRFATAAEVDRELAAVTAELPAATLAAPAGGTETIEGATRLLESRGAEPPLMPPGAEGPPPPTFSEGPGAGPRGTVAGAEAVSPSTAAADPATAPAALGPRGTVVAPPAGLAGGGAATPPSASAAPAAGAAAPGGAAAARSGSARRLAVPIAAGCLLLLAMAAGGLYFLAQGPLRSSPLLRDFAERTEPGVAGADSVAERLGETGSGGERGPGETEEADAVAGPGARGSLPLERPEPGQGDDEGDPPGTRRAGAEDGAAEGDRSAGGSSSSDDPPESGAERAGRSGTPPGAEPRSGDSVAERRTPSSESATRSAPPPSPSSTRTDSATGDAAGTTPGSAPPSGPDSGSPSTPSAAPPAAEPPPASPADRRAARVPDTGITSGLGLSFRVLPDDAFVLLDGTVIGRASEWKPGTGHYQLPGPGTYDVTLRKGGMRDRVIRVVASADGPAVTPVAARLEPLPPDEVEVGDLEVHRVREAVAFKVVPRVARVLVDGQLVGPASQYSGGIGGRRWLELPRGTYRVSLVAPGHQRVDLAVEFTGGAVEARKRVDVILPAAPGAN